MKNRMAKLVLFVTLAMFLLGMTTRSVSADINSLPKDEPTIPIELEQ